MPETRAANDYADLVAGRPVGSGAARRPSLLSKGSPPTGYGSSLVAGLFVLLPVAALVGGVALLAKRPSPPRAPPAQPVSRVAEDLEACSPFASLDGRRLLSFNARRGAVAEGEAVSTANGQLDLAIDLDAVVDDTPRSAPVRASGAITIGRFRVDGATRKVVLQLPAGPAAYTLLTPMPLDQDGCVLVDGTTAAADLDHSWFGTPASDPPRDDTRHDP